MTSDLNWLDDDYEQRAQQQQEEEFRRRVEEERERYRAAHPLWDKCVEHPDRQRDGEQPYCAECLENHRRNYADPKVRVVFGHTYEPHGPLIERGTGYYRETRLK